MHHEMVSTHGRCAISLRFPLIYVIFNHIVRLTHAALPNGNVYMRMHAALGPISTDPPFAAFFSRIGQLAADPA